MSVTKKISIIKANGQPDRSSNIGAEAQYIDVSRDAQGKIIPDITGIFPSSTESVAQTLKNIEETKKNIKDSPNQGNLCGVIENATRTVENYSLDGSTIVNIVPNIASGDFAHAEGISYSIIGETPITCNTVASGRSSHAEGEGTTAYGINSHAEGKETYANGRRSHAEGRQTIANDDNSHAEGYATTADGENAHAEGDRTYADSSSHAEGGYTTAMGGSHAEGGTTYAEQVSHAEGLATTAIGQYSHTEGQQTIASGDMSHAEGHQTSASGNYGSHAEGNETKASGIFSHAEGEMTIANSESSHSEGSMTSAIGVSSHAEGGSTEAYGDVSHAEGYYTTAGGNFSHTEGNMVRTEGNSSHAEGERTIASGKSSHAEGDHTIASGENSHAEGSFTTASGDWSHAEGAGSIASGEYCHAEGYCTSALDWYANTSGIQTIAYYNQTVIGALNEEKDGYFIVGCGDDFDETRANCFRVDGADTYGMAYHNSGADYAEMFEWIDQNINDEDRVGKFVTLDGDKIKLATSQDDYILGIISGNASVIGNDYADQWHGMFETDIYGRPIYEQKNNLKNNSIINRKVRKVNPNYDNTQKYIARSDRPEWDAVGLIGRLICIDDGTSEVNNYVKVTDESIATKSNEKTRFRVLKRLDENHIQIMIL